MIKSLVFAMLLSVSHTDEVSRVVPGLRFAGGNQFEELFKHNTVSEDDARAKIERFAEKERPADLPYLGDLEGILNDEYVFNYLDSVHKRGFVTFGYRVNIHNGSVRYVSREQAQKEFNGAFPSGYIEPAQMRKFRPKSDKRE